MCEGSGAQRFRSCRSSRVSSQAWLWRLGARSNETGASLALTGAPCSDGLCRDMTGCDGHQSEGSDHAHGHYIG